MHRQDDNAVSSTRDLMAGSVNQLCSLQVPPHDCAVCRACGQDELRGVVLNPSDTLLMSELMQKLAGCQVPHLSIYSAVERQSWVTKRA